MRKVKIFGGRGKLSRATPLELTQHPLGKRIHSNSILAQQGVNLIATRVTDMGFMWTPTTSASDAGIDGFIEIRRSDTGEATNLIIQVQSKATGREWENETADGFWFRCDERDLNYWIQGNAPVILVVSRPSSTEAYWISVKDYFTDLERRKARKVYFDKGLNVFDSDCATSLTEIAKPKEYGLYLAAPPLPETLRTNLLPVGRYAQRIYAAETELREREPVLEKLRAAGLKGAYEFFLKSEKIFSFYDLRKEPWPTVCKASTTRDFAADDWALSDDVVNRNDFVKLLNGALRAFLGAKGIWFHQPRNGYGYFYYAPSLPAATDTEKPLPNTSICTGAELAPKVIGWKFHKESERTVFRAYYGKKDPSRIIYYRHLAFEPKFHRFGSTWYLELTPTYHFTSDGHKISNYAESYRAGIKRIEKHGAVHANVRFWGYVLTDRGLFTKAADFLTLCEPMTLDVQFGIPEQEWLGRADTEERERLADEDDAQIQLFE